jgi:hypothetical protein
MLENTSRIAIIVIAVCLSFNVLRDLVGMFVGTAPLKHTAFQSWQGACLV